MSDPNLPALWILLFNLEQDVQRRSRSCLPSDVPVKARQNVLTHHGQDTLNGEIIPQMFRVLNSLQVLQTTNKSKFLPRLMCAQRTTSERVVTPPSTCSCALEAVGAVWSRPLLQHAR